MAVKIGSARSSYGDTTPGDQTSNGREVSTQDWYMHSLGWVIIRPLSAAAAEKIAVAMERACANNKIGYDQATRSTLYNAVKNKGFDPGACTVAVNTDCSALVRVCLAYAGINVANFRTSTEIDILENSGAFNVIRDTSKCKTSDYLCRGDILCTRSKGHTVVVLSNGSKVKTAAGTVTIAPEKWNVRSGPGTSYQVVAIVRQGATYEVVERDAATGWIKIKNTYGGAGWISPKAVV